MSNTGLWVLFGLAVVVVGWASQNTNRVPGGKNAPMTAPTNVNAAGTAAPGQIAAPNNQSGDYSTGVNP
jgi:hypothetical protein